MNRSMPDLPVHHQLPEFTQTRIHRVSDAIQPSHPLSSPSPDVLFHPRNTAFYLLRSYRQIFKLSIKRVLRDSPGGTMAKSPPTVQELWVWSLGQKDPLEKEMATHSTISARDNPMDRKPGRLQSMGSQRAGYNLVTKQQEQRALNRLQEPVSSYEDARSLQWRNI